MTNNNKFFVTSSGTEIGKTLVTAMLCHQLKLKGEKVQAYKPVISGFSEGDHDSDLHILLESLGLEINSRNIEEISAYRFKEPLSPHIAAEREGQQIDFERLAQTCLKKIKDTEGYLFIEGAGGVMAPISKSQTFLDLAGVLKIPSLLVVGSYLGAISHALTAFEALNKRSQVKAIIVSESPESPMPPEETASTISGFTGVKTIILPRIHNIDYKWKHSFPILEQLGI